MPLFWLPSVTLLDDSTDPDQTEVVPLQIRSGSVVVRVPTESTRIDGKELFGPVVWFLVLQTADGLRISGYAEDFAFE